MLENVEKLEIINRFDLSEQWAYEFTEREESHRTPPLTLKELEAEGMAIIELNYRMKGVCEE